jgi:hypothetical protein
MIKFIAAAVWLGAVTIGSVFYSFQSAQGLPENRVEPSIFGGLEQIRSEIISVPVVKNGQITGYFLTRLLYTAEAEKLKRLTVPAEALIIDVVYGYLFANPQIDFSRKEQIDLDLFRDGIRDSVNERVKDTLIHDVLIQQIEYLAKAEMRDSSIRVWIDAAAAEAR